MMISWRHAWEVTMSLTIWNAPNNAPSWIFSDVPAVKLYLHGGDISPECLTRVNRQIVKDNYKIVHSWGLIHAVFQQYRTQILLPVFVQTTGKLLPGSSLVPTPRERSGYEASQARNSSSTYSTFAIFSRRIILTLGGKSTAQEIQSIRWIYYYTTGNSVKNQPLCT